MKKISCLLILTALSNLAISQICNKPFTIVLLGSSTAAGAGASIIENSWAHKYEDYLKQINPNYIFKDLAIGGFTTYDAQPNNYIPPVNRPKPVNGHNITAALLLHPDALIISFPANDAAQGYTLKEQQANFKRITDEAGRLHIAVWVTTPQPRNHLNSHGVVRQDSLYDWIRTYYGDKSIDFRTGLESAKDSILSIYNSGDGIHLNDAGHEIFFKRVVNKQIPDTLCLRSYSSAGSSTGCTKPFRIVILGSSTAAGYGASPRDSGWAFKLERYLKSVNSGYVIDNLAVGGSTTYNMQASSFIPPAGRPAPDKLHNLSTALALHPDAVIINFASNDAVNFFSISEQQDNYKRVTDVLNKLNIPVWVSTTQPRDNLKTYPVQSQLLMRKWITDYYGKKSVDFWTGIASSKDSILFKYAYKDGIHLNNAGHEILFTRILALHIPDSLCLRSQGSCSEPTGMITKYITATHAVVYWNHTKAVSYNLQFKNIASNTWQTINTTKDSLLLPGLACGTGYVYRIQSVCSISSASAYSPELYFTTAPCVSCGVLPAIYSTMDIGSVGKTGEACFTGPDKFLLKGSGIDIFDKADAFRYMYSSFKGDGTIQVKLDVLDTVNGWNKAGVMFRESLAAGARNVFMGITTSFGSAFQYRTLVNGPTNKISFHKNNAPNYLRIIKKGSTYTGYISADGIIWEMVNTVTLPGFGVNNSIYAGIAITSHDDTKLSTAIFSNLVQTNSIAARLYDTGKPDTLPGLFTGTQKLSLLKVYPNPSSANFIVDFNIDTPQNILLAITGLGDGRIYHAENLVNFSGRYHKYFNRFNLAKGSYVISIKTGSSIKSVIFIKE